MGGGLVPKVSEGHGRVQRGPRAGSGLRGGEGSGGPGSGSGSQAAPVAAPRRRALTRGPAVGAVSVAGARRLQQLQQPLLVALAVAHGRLRGLSGAQPMSRGPSWAGGVAPSWSASRLSCAAASSAPSRLSAPPRARPVLAPALQTPLWL